MRKIFSAAPRSLLIRAIRPCSLSTSVELASIFAAVSPWILACGISFCVRSQLAYARCTRMLFGSGLDRFIEPVAGQLGVVFLRQSCAMLTVGGSSVASSLTACWSSR